LQTILVCLILINPYFIDLFGSGTNFGALQPQMDFAFNIYALTLIFFGSSTLFLSLYILNNESGAVKWVGLLMLSNSIWSIAYGLELGSSTLSQMKFLVNIEYLGIASLPFNWFLFCLDLAGKGKWIRKNSNKVLVTIVPLLTLVILWTNDFHHLYYKQLSVDNNGSFPMLKITPGISYYLFTIYFYILLAAGNYMLIKKFRNSDAVYRKQNRMVMLGALLPWIANFCYMIGLRPLANLDVTPFAFVISTILIFVAIYRFELFDTLPVAREKVLELMQDAFIVLDHQNRIIDYNSAFKKYTCAKHSGQLIGTNIKDIMPNQPELAKVLKEHQSGKLELLVEINAEKFDTEVNVSFLNENKLHRSAVILKFQDLTTLRQDALRSKLQADELQRLNQLKDRIFSIMAHDLRGPLLNLSEVLKMTTDDTISTEEFKVLAPALSKDISYTAALLENILHWSRSQLKGYSINKEIFDFKALILAEINYHHKSAATKKIEIIQNLEDELYAHADYVMMQMVIRNLLSNAIKFCHSNCEIEVSSSYLSGNFITMCIKDNGIGISDENIQRIFSGENVSSRGTQNEKGTGIGLMVCWDFMERNAGTITIDSKVGKGTTFSLSIPRSIA
jgi:signal transduction histidine kinase